MLKLTFFKIILKVKNKKRFCSTWLLSWELNLNLDENFFSLILLHCYFAVLNKYMGFFVVIMSHVTSVYLDELRGTERQMCRLSFCLPLSPRAGLQVRRCHFLVISFSHLHLVSLFPSTVLFLYLVSVLFARYV